MRFTITPNLAGDLSYDWQFVSERFDDPYVDPRMIAAIHESLVGQARFWNVIVYDEDDHPAAVACFFAQRADAFMMAPPKLKRAHPLCPSRMAGTVSVPDVVLRAACLGRLELTAHSPRRGCRGGPRGTRTGPRRNSRYRPAALLGLDGIRRRGAAPMDSLTGLGYAHADSPPMYVLPANGRTFEEYVRAMKSHYRMMVTRAERRIPLALSRRQPFWRRSVSRGVYRRNIPVVRAGRRPCRHRHACAAGRIFSRHGPPFRRAVSIDDHLPRR